MKVGFIGFGTRGSQLADCFQYFNIEITAITDINSGTFNQYKWKKVPLFVSLDEFWNLVDTVIITTPDYLHKKYILEALKRDKNIYVEKPICIDLESCNQIMSSFMRSDKILFPGHNLRYFTVIDKLNELIKQDVVGDIISIWCNHYVGHGYTYYERWHSDISKSGGPLITKSVHDFDIIHMLGNSFTEKISAKGKSLVFNKSDFPDFISVDLQLKNGIDVNYSTCLFAQQIDCREYIIFGTTGTLRNIGDHPNVATIQLYKKGLKKFKPYNEWNFSKEPGFHGLADQRIIKSFINCTKKDLSLVENAIQAVRTAYWATYSLNHENIICEV